MTASSMPRNFSDATAARAIVEHIDRRRRTVLSTAPVLDDATALLLTWLSAATSQHGIDVTSYDWGNRFDRLAHVALDVVAHDVRTPRPANSDDRTQLLDAVIIRLAERNITTHRHELYVPLPRVATTPYWGAFLIPRPLAITISEDGSWALVIDQPNGSPRVTIAGRSDHASIDDMLDVALAANDGAFGDILH